jgi:hypothetical protein
LEIAMDHDLSLYDLEDGPETQEELGDLRRDVDLLAGALGLDLESLARGADRGRHSSALDVVCPKCGAFAGASCKTKGGRVSRFDHRQRRLAWENGWPREGTPERLVFDRARENRPA